jgi:hypothetical protein
MHLSLASSFRSPHIAPNAESMCEVGVVTRAVKGIAFGRKSYAGHTLGRLTTIPRLARLSPSTYWQEPPLPGELIPPKHTVRLFWTARIADVNFPLRLEKRPSSGRSSGALGSWRADQSLLWHGRPAMTRDLERDQSSREAREERRADRLTQASGFVRSPSGSRLVGGSNWSATRKRSSGAAALQSGRPAAPKRAVMRPSWPTVELDRTYRMRSM